MDKSFAAVLAAPHPEEEKRRTLAALSLPPTILSAIALGIALKAAGGDVSAANFIREVTGGNAAEETTDLTPYTEEELRALLDHLQEDTHDTRAETH